MLSQVEPNCPLHSTVANTGSVHVWRNLAVPFRLSFLASLGALASLVPFEEAHFIMLHGKTCLGSRFYL